jgi:GNAT superfamily N-acetyltransferase
VRGFKIRRATPKDAELLVRHRRLMFKEMLHPKASDLDEMDRSYRGWALELMRRRRFHGYIVTAGRGRVAASGCLWLREVQPSPGQPSGMVPYVLSVYTEPEFRRKGLASMIVKQAMDWSKKKGYRKMTLHASRAGRRVYEKLGWTAGREMEFYFE